MAKQPTSTQESAPKEEIIDETIKLDGAAESTNPVDGGTDAAIDPESPEPEGTEGTEETTDQPDLDTEEADDTAELAAALAAAAAASPQAPLEVVGLDTAEEQAKDYPETPEVPEQQNNPTVADAPEAAVKVTPSARLPFATLEQFPNKADIKVQQANISLQLIADALRSYSDAMAPNVQANATVGKGQQLNLWRTIDKVLKLEGAEFIKGYGLLLDWVAQNRKGALSEKYMYRYFSEMALSSVDRRNFDRMLNLLTATCDPATRRLGLQQVDLVATLAGFRDGAIQQRVTEFYSL